MEVKDIGKMMFPWSGELGNFKVSSICPVNCHASMIFILRFMLVFQWLLLCQSLNNGEFPSHRMHSHIPIILTLCQARVALEDFRRKNGLWRTEFSFLLMINLFVVYVKIHFKIFVIACLCDAVIFSNNGLIIKYMVLVYLHHHFCSFWEQLCQILL